MDEIILKVMDMHILSILSDRDVKNMPNAKHHCSDPDIEITQE
jgi:hypothetical protein